MFRVPRPGLLVLVTLLLPVAVLATPRQTSSGPPAPALSDSWKEIRTPDLIVAGNARASVLQEILRELTRFRATLAMLFPEVKTSGHAPTWVVALRDDRAFTRFLPLDSAGKRQSNVGAYFLRRENANFLVLEGSGRELDLETVFHEYTHYLVSRNVRVNVPMWLNEGLAEFYSTFRGDFRGRTMLGAVPSRARVLGGATFVPLREIVVPRDLEEMWRWDTRIGMFYAESWALVHYIVVERKNPVPNPVGTYLSSLARTGSNDAAFKEAFGTDIEGMDRELRQYVRRVSLNAVVIDAQVDLSTKLDAQPMLEADVTALEGTLLFELGSLEEAERELAPAGKRQPANAAEAVALARLRIAQDREAEALTLLQQVVAGAPGDGPAHYHLGQAFAKAWRHDEALAAFERATALMPASPFPWAGLSTSALALKRDAQAAAALARALQIEPLPSLHWAHGIAALRLGRNDVAAASLATYLKQRGGGEDVSIYPLFVHALASWRANRPADAEAALAAAEKAPNQEKWTITVLKYLQGRIDAEQFLRSASNLGERTEANTYVGFKLSLAGREDEAAARFTWVAQQGAKNYLEYNLARNELERLEHARSQPVSPTVR